MKWRDVILGLTVVFSAAIAVTPWMGIAACLFTCILVLENHRIKVKVQVEGEIIAKVTELENTVRQMRVHNQQAATPAPMRGMR
jgi:hypothetical protein